MKRFLSLLLSLLMVFSLFSSAVSAEGECFASGEITVEGADSFFWNIDEEGGVLTLMGTGEMPEFIEKPWMDYDFSVLSIGEGITSVSEEAFLYALCLEEVLLPESVTVIKERAFYGCENLVNAELSNTASVEAMAFYGCMAYTDIKIPETVENIGAYAFGYYCNEELDDALAKIPGATISSFLGGAAQEYAADNEITFIDTTDYSSFFEYAQLTDDTVAITAFKGCDFSENIKIPSEINGFKVTSLKDFVFENTDVESIVIPSSVEEISDTAFEGAKALTSIIVEDGGSFSSYGGALYNKSLTELLKYPEGAVQISFPETVNTIGKNAFRYSSAEAVELPDSITSIGEGAFAFSSVKTVSLPEIKTIPDWCFMGCEALSEITIPETVETVGENAFRDCKVLTEIDLPVGIKTIGAGSFHGTGAEAVLIPQGVSSVGEKAFGYYSEADIEFVKDEDFEIFGKIDTVACTYAENNGFKFTDVSPESAEFVSVYAGKACITVIWNEVKGVESYELYRKTAGGDYKKLATVNDVVYYDFDVENSKEYTYSVKVIKNNFTSDTKVPLSAKFEVLSTPELVSAKGADDGITVKWNTVKSAKGYIIYRKTESGKWTRLAEITGSVSSFKDTTAKNGVSYTYTVKAYSGTLESGCDYSGVTAMRLATPSIKSVTNASNGVSVKWSKVTGAEGYYVYRKVSGAKSYTKIATVKKGSTVSYTDKEAKSGTTYYYTVKAYHGADVSKTKASDAIKYLATPVVKASNTSNGVSVKWNKITGAKGYYVYRKAVGEKKYTKIATIKKASTVSYTDKKAKAGTTYLYTVKAYNGSYASAIKASGEIKYLKAPVLSSTKNVSTGVTLKWKKVTGASGYYIYRKTENGSYSKVGTVKGGSTLSFTDKTVKSATIYYYTVKAYSGKSVSVYNSDGILARYVAAPTLKSVKNSDSGITLKWGKVSGAQGYIVYRKTASGEYAAIKTIQSGSTLSYTDKTVKNGKTYTYFVKAYKGVVKSASSKTYKIKAG